ncbi:hypothetical protein AVP41_02742 [Microbacterium sp. TNHR37B]|nr:hypothetical protein AVP41_02742 [Microbacterium sp. TNHR37B]
MTDRRVDGSAGDVDYGTIGVGYATYRRPDPRIDAAINAALDGARTADLDSGVWDARYGHLRALPRFDGSLRLVVSRPTRN